MSAISGDRDLGYSSGVFFCPLHSTCYPVFVAGSNRHCHQILTGSFPPSLVDLRFQTAWQ